MNVVLWKPKYMTVVTTKIVVAVKCTNKRTRSQMLEVWLTLSSRLIAIQCKSVNKTNHVIHWIVIYPMDNFTHLSKHLGLNFSKLLIIHHAYINNSLHLVWIYAWIFVRGQVFCEKRTVFRERIVSIIIQIFFATRTVLKIGEYSQIFPSVSWGIFGHMMHLDQL